MTVCSTSRLPTERMEFTPVPLQVVFSGEHLTTFLTFPANFSNVVPLRPRLVTCMIVSY